MEPFNTCSLEEDDGEELFLTQQVREISVACAEEENEENREFLGLDYNDFTSPCKSLIGQNVSPYEDISDAEDFEQENDVTDNNR